MLHYCQGEYLLTVDNITYQVMKKAVPSNKRQQQYKDVLSVNGIVLLTMDDLHTYFADLYDYLQSSLPLKDQHIAYVKPIVLWMRFLLSQAPLLSTKKSKKLSLTCNVVEMSPLTHEWYCRGDYTIRSNKHYPYLQFKVNQHIAFAPHEINAFHEVFLFEKNILRLLYNHDAYLDSDCCCAMLSDYLNGMLTLEDFDEFECYLDISKVACSMDQYERWKDQKNHAEEIHIYV